MIHRPPISTLFPYMTLFRSRPRRRAHSGPHRYGSGYRRNPIAAGDVPCSDVHPSHTRWPRPPRSEEHTSELQSQSNLVCRLLLEKKKKKIISCEPELLPKPV